jgi:hypothetical protein
MKLIADDPIIARIERTGYPYDHIEDEDDELKGENDDD